VLVSSHGKLRVDFATRIHITHTMGFQGSGEVDSTRLMDAFVALFGEAAVQALNAAKDRSPARRG
jgi:hypothetical protein